MKKIICIPFFLSVLLFIVSCTGTVNPVNPDDSQNTNNQQQENQQQENQQSSIVNKFFWGTWVRMDSGAVYVIDESTISVYNKDSTQISKVYDAISSNASELSVNEIGKFSKQSDSVIQNNAIPYFRKGGSNLSYSLKLVGFDDTVSRAASSVSALNVKVKAASKKYKSYKEETQPSEEGLINLKAPVSGDIQTLTISTTDTTLVIPGIKIENDGSDMGTIPVTNPGDYSLKVTGLINDEEKDDGYLYGNYFKTYSMILTITNISEVTSETSACEIKSKNPELKITDENGAAINAITISTLKPGLTKEIKLKVSYGTIDSGFVDTGLNIDITNMKTHRTWKDFVPLRFFKGMIPITVNAKSTEENNDAALNGFVIYPDYNSQFFDIPHGTSRTIYIPDFGKDKTYTLSFSGATVEGELSNSTEMYYVVNPGTTEQDDFTIPTTKESIDRSFNFGEPNDTELASAEVSEKFMAYLNDGDIDFFAVKVDYKNFISPDKAVLYKVIFEDSYNPENSYVKIFNANEKLGSSYTRKNSSLPEGYDSFLGWYLNGSKKSENYTVTSNITLQAKYNPKKYTISYKSMNNLAYYDTTTSSYTIEEEVTLYTPSRTGYTFEGWYDNYNYTGQSITVIPKGSTGDKTFYAKWSENNYSITYELNGGTNNDFNKATYTVNETFTIAAPTKTGYTFEGWYQKPDFSGSKITLVNSGSTGDLTLYAKWTPVKYTITYYLNDGTNSSDNPDYYTIEESVNFVSPSRYGYAFLGWYEKSDFSGNKITSISLGTTGNTTLYAKWGLGDYSITYELNGGTNAQSNPARYSLNDSITLASPERTGYTFAGWYTKSDFTGDAITSISTGSTGNLTLYAKWTPTNYNITYYLNGGTNSSNNPRYYTIEQSINLEDPSRNGYVFLGWYDLTGNKITQIPKRSTGAKYLEAKWGVSLSISVSTSSLSDISVTQSQTTEGITFTADTGYSSYSWEVDGTRQSANGNTFVFNTQNLSPGVYEIYLEAKSGTIIRSSLLYVKVEAE